MLTNEQKFELCRPIERVFFDETNGHSETHSSDWSTAKTIIDVLLEQGWIPPVGEKPLDDIIAIEWDAVLPGMTIIATNGDGTTITGMVKDIPGDTITFGIGRVWIMRPGWSLQLDAS